LWYTKIKKKIAEPIIKLIPIERDAYVEMLEEEVLSLKTDMFNMQKKMADDKKEPAEGSYAWHRQQQLEMAASMRYQAPVGSFFIQTGSDIRAQQGISSGAALQHQAAAQVQASMQSMSQQLARGLYSDDRYSHAIDRAGIVDRVTGQFIPSYRGGQGE
jgi:hypothetical protein